MTLSPSSNAAAHAARAHLVAERVLAYDATPEHDEAEELLDCDLHGGWHPQIDEHLERCHDIGRHCRHIFGGRLPPLAAQTWFSLHLATMSPNAWAAFLSGFEPHAGDRLLLADRGDLSALPAAIAAWGGERLAVGASLFLPSGDEALIMAPDQPAYARLCRLLSRCHEEGGFLPRWQADRCTPPDCTGLIVLLRDLDWLITLREAGAEVYWRGELYPEPVPAGVPCACLPLIRHADGEAASLGPVLDALRLRRHVPRGQRGLQEAGRAHLLARLQELPARYRGLEDRLERGRELLRRCRYVPDGSLHMPPWPLGQSGPGGDAGAELKRLAVAGMHARYGGDPPQAAIDRLAHELRVIREKDFAGYILTVYELAQRRRTCGRGSAASSIVCYCLGLTNVDPVRYGLVFERFLAPERMDPPDIDLDFPWDERDRVFAAALERCGREHVALVSTHLHFRHWSALREVARVHGQPRQQISAVRRALRSVGRFGGQVPLPRPWGDLLKRAEALLGAPRHYGLHPGGLIVTAAPIRDLVPVHLASKRVDGEPLPAIAWEKDGAEAMGLVKIDLLGNRSLAVVRDCLDDLRELGIDIDERKWHPQDDPSCRRLVASGQTMGCFYIESPAMRQLNAKAGSGDFDRLIVHSSIIRPAANTWINDYLERLHHHRATGEVKAEWFPHPALRGLLSESYGILSYQEDVMLAAKELAGFGSAEQNQLRKALGKSDTRARLQRFAERFASGCAERGVSDAVRDLVWGMITSFAGYSFCKAHSASYAMVSFQCAWLKAHHPAAFMARVIANGGGFYSPSAYIEEARRAGVRIRGLCVLRSRWATAPEGGCALRVGLHLVPYLPRATGLMIEQAAAMKPFVSFTDFWLRCRPSLRSCESLEQAGAFNRLLAHCHAGQRLPLIRQVAAAYPRHLRDDPLQHQLVEQGGFADPPPDAAIPAPDGYGVLRDRFGHLGFLPQMHPLLLWDLPRRRLRCNQVTARLHDKRIHLLAWCITRKQVDAHGSDGGVQAMSFVTVEDETGIVETIWFPDCYAKHGWLLDELRPLHLEGVVQVEYGFATLIVDRASPYDPGRHRRYRSRRGSTPVTAVTIDLDAAG